jgi:squalene-associated FAD-dependent desaturase
MIQLDASYAACQGIAQVSGSNFYRAFDFLRLDRRRAMTALYAFSRLADDATDGDSDQTWRAEDWVQWIEGLDQNPSPNRLEPLEAIRLALADSVERFAIPKELLKQIVLGVDQDSRPQVIEHYDQLQSYMYRVASAVGLSCMAIWSTKGVPLVGTREHRMAVDCGHAFQLTNILRDLVEDAQRGRMYLAQEDLVRFGFHRESLIQALRGSDRARGVHEVEQLGDWNGLMRLYCQRAEGCYDQARGLGSHLDADGQRMFAMIWQTYYQIFKQIQDDPRSPLIGRPSLGLPQKIKLYVSHAFTPWFRSIIAPEPRTTFRSDAMWEGSPRVAVVGGGLAGIQTAMHLSKHGCETWLIESRSRLGGRVGSFIDPQSGQAIDYCQHVGMRCCGELIRFIEETGQRDQWQEQSTLWFRSRAGKPFQAAAWPLPAPFHLSGLLLKWPDLSLVDRIAIASALGKLIRTRPTRDFERQMALEWLKAQRQPRNAIDSFWSTILVSALGEQLPRITMGSVHKVMIDGFAATKDAYHLLVPQRSLSELIDQAAQESLAKIGVRLVVGQAVEGLSRNPSGTWGVGVKTKSDSAVKLPLLPDRSELPAMPAMPAMPEFQAVVLAVPWHRLGTILRDTGLEHLPGAAKTLSDVQGLESAPITGVHTWWSKKWFNDPHAILIDRLCQWVFPGPGESDPNASEHYYQIVISGSRDLPKGDTEAVLRSVESDLREVFPELGNSGAKLLRGKVVTDPQSVFSVSRGHDESRLDTATFGAQGLFLAGDWTATGWPATMEGALRSGSLAANQVLHYVGRAAEVSVDR